MENRSTSSPSYDATQGAEQVAFRALRFSLPEFETDIPLLAWNIAFQQHPLSRARYRRLIRVMNEVDGTGHMAMQIAGVPAEHSASMPERKGVIGEFETTWVTRPLEASGERGAVLIGLNGIIVHVLAIPPIQEEGETHTFQIVEDVAHSIASREPEMLMAAEVEKPEAMSRLPEKSDLPSSASHIAVSDEWYEDRR